MDNKIKNLVSLIILLIGLLAGSLFVDFAQLVRGTGFSRKNLGKTELFQVDGKTWVAYDEPIVDIQVVNDDTCSECSPDEVLAWLRSVMPTVSPKKVSYDSIEGKVLIDKFEIKSLPTFIVSESVNKTDLFSQAQTIFKESNKKYVLKTQELGIVPGKYLEGPGLSDGDVYFGKNDSAVRVSIFADFQCPYSKIFWTVLRSAMKEYGDRVGFVYKNVPLAANESSNRAALAADCAFEQNKFWEYGDKLFANQEKWSDSKDDTFFKLYAAGLGMNIGQFNKCLQEKKYQTQVDDIVEEANNFGISGTPTIFVNSQFKNGVIDINALKDLIENELRNN
jgi:protein-disulfide isomerase